MKDHDCESCVSYAYAGKRIAECVLRGVMVRGSLLNMPCWRLHPDIEAWEDVSERIHERISHLVGLGVDKAKAITIALDEAYPLAKVKQEYRGVFHKIQ